MRFLVLIVCLIPCLAYPQVVVDFESGIPGNWVRDPDSWGLDSLAPISGLYSFKHIKDNSESGTDLAYLPLLDLKIEMGACWSFRLRHGYNPSSSNKWTVILASDEIPDSKFTGGTYNGIVLGVNLDGYDDTLRLWRIRQGTTEIIASSSLNWQKDIGTEDAQEIIVERTVGGEWKLYITQDGDNRELIAGGFDNSIFASAYFGICYSYTSSCDRLLWFDDIFIDGHFEEDIESPSISSAEFIKNNTVRVSFNEPIRHYQLTNSDFKISPGDHIPAVISLKDSRMIDLEFNMPFQNKSIYYLDASNICDLAGNCSDCEAFEFVLAYPEWGDIVITELMPDPSPPVYLPEIEYFEIYNRTGFSINLRSLYLWNNNSICRFPDYIFEPGAYLAVCDSEDSLLIDGDIPFISLESFPSLNNNSDYLLLFDTLAGTVSGVEYNKKWYNKHLKNEGGWAFEMIDPSCPFSGSSNWSFSTDLNGGSPGRVNSVNDNNPDLLEPYIKNCYAATTSSLIVEFSEPVDVLNNSSIGISFNGTRVEEIEKLDSLRRSYSVKPAEDLLPGVLYTLDFSNVRDYAGNSLRPTYCQAGLPSRPLSGDLIINEVLFDPLPGQPDFIEFYNRSEKVLDASSLIVTCINLHSGDTGSVTYLSASPRCILPGSYYVVCEDKAALSAAYFSSDPQNIFEPGKLTALPDDKGRILLLRRGLGVIDDFSYYDDYHNDMLSSRSGISLERISHEIESNNRSNWLSATGISGWATPGVKNSVSTGPVSNGESSLSFSSSRITPDNDGYEDYLLIQFNLEEGEWLIDARVYNDMGYRLNTLCNKLTAYGRETLLWQGTDYNGKLLPTGIYIIFIEAVSSTGKVLRWKKVCSVLRP